MSGAASFRNDIQGLRALAVVPVVLYHADARLIPGGFVGVDVFFVISGYLITQILLRELASGTYSLGGFYERRVKRLFPALYAMLTATLIFGGLVLSPADFAQLGQTALATVFFASNVMFFGLSGYFDGAAEIKPLLHTWSLAVEEQFYLVFPLVLAGLFRFAPRLLKPALWAGAILSLILCVLASRGHQSAAFYLPFTRAYELLIGAILAANAVPKLRDVRVLDGLSLAGLALLGVSFFAIDKTSVFPGWLALVPSLGCALVIYAGQGRQSLGGNLLSYRPFLWIGALSYSLYLWHWPVLVYSRYTAAGEPGAGRQAFAVLVAVLLAAASWRWIEQPVIRRPVSGARVLAGGGGAMLAGAFASLLLVVSAGMPARFDRATLALFAGAEDNSPHRARCHANGWDAMAYDRHCVFGAKDAPPTLAVWGDSFGAELSVALGEAAAVQDRALLQITSSACPPTIGYAVAVRPRCDGLNARTLASLIADRRIDTVLMVANYNRYAPDIAGLMSGFERAATALAAANKTLVIAYPMPAMPSDAPRTLGVLADRGEAPEAFGQPVKDYAQVNDPVLRALDEMSARLGAEKLLPAEKLCGKALCPAWRPDAGVLYFDHEHLSLAGARLLVDGGRQTKTAAR